MSLPSLSPSSLSYITNIIIIITIIIFITFTIRCFTNHHITFHYNDNDDYNIGGPLKSKLNYSGLTSYTSKIPVYRKNPNHKQLINDDQNPNHKQLINDDQNTPSICTNNNIHLINYTNDGDNNVIHDIIEEPSSPLSISMIKTDLKIKSLFEQIKSMELLNLSHSIEDALNVFDTYSTNNNSTAFSNLLNNNNDHSIEEDSIDSNLNLFYSPNGSLVDSRMSVGNVSVDDSVEKLNKEESFRNVNLEDSYVTVTTAPLSIKTIAKVGMNAASMRSKSSPIKNIQNNKYNLKKSMINNDSYNNHNKSKYKSVVSNNSNINNKQVAAISNTKDKYYSNDMDKNKEKIKKKSKKIHSTNNRSMMMISHVSNNNDDDNYNDDDSDKIIKYNDNVSVDENITQLYSRIQTISNSFELHEIISLPPISYTSSALSVSQKQSHYMTLPHSKAPISLSAASSVVPYSNQNVIEMNIDKTDQFQQVMSNIYIYIYIYWNIPIISFFS